MLRRPDKKFGVNSYSQPACCKGAINFISSKRFQRGLRTVGQLTNQYQQRPIILITLM